MLRFSGEAQNVGVYSFSIGEICYVRSWARQGHREKICIKRRRYHDGATYECTLNGLYLESELMTPADFADEFPNL